MAGLKINPSKNYVMHRGIAYQSAAYPTHPRVDYAASAELPMAINKRKKLTRKQA
jgi:hypothetical protein